MTTNNDCNVVEFNRSARSKSTSGKPVAHDIAIGIERKGHKQVKSIVSDDARTRHIILVGASGTGKSTLMKSMICQLLDNKRGESLVLMDPHGELYDAALQSNENKHKLMKIDLSAKNQRFSCNPLAYNAEDEWFSVSKIVNDLLETFDHMYDMRKAGGPVFELYMRNALMLLITDIDTHTLDDIEKVFLNREYRGKLVARSGHDAVVAFWKNAESIEGEHNLANMSAYITSKVTSFTSNPLVRNIIGRKQNSFDFARLFRSPIKIFVKFHKGILGGTNVRLLGTILLNRIYSAAMREHQRGNKTMRCNIVLDEAHNFLTPSMIDMFPEARKFGINMIIAHQNLGQMQSRHVNDSIDTLLSNVGNIIAFRLGPKDADFLRGYYSPSFSQSELQNMPNFQALARLLTARGVLPPSRVMTEQF